MMRSTRSLATALALACLSLCLTPGCQASEPAGNWSSGVLVAPSDRVVREMIVSGLEELDFPLLSGFDSAKREIVSGWFNSLSVYSGKGYRLQAEVRYDAVERGRYTIEVRVKKMLNMNMSFPSDPGYAEWEWTDDDVEAARILMMKIASRLPDEIDVGDPVDPLEGLR